ncbi:MAG: ankyrin repeat domain-containing protein [Hyphomicrobiaceae bacterium]
MFKSVTPIYRCWQQTLMVASMVLWSQMVLGQTAPTSQELAAYEGLHLTAWKNDVAEIRKLIASGANPNARDRAGRTPLHVAAFGSHDDAVAELVQGGADPNALENERYDIVTIAAVANDPQLVEQAIKLGANPRNITSIYDGTALIAAAHLGHVEVVKVLIRAGAPLDHVNNLGWTALIEAVVLGNGGPHHVETVRALFAAGADKSISDRNGETPLMMARARRYDHIVEILK